jgi:16S rRNA (uracil1498-N3)-methyltransferase
MIMHEQNGYLILAHLSNIELYYAPPENVDGVKISLEGEEYHHAVNVMRNSVGDLIHITDGNGNLFKSKISEIKKSKLNAEIIETEQFEDKASNIYFCLPILKNSDRQKFAIEKCVELGITNFILFTSKHTIPKKIKIEKFNKTALAAMKQSLRTFSPKITSSTFDDIIKSPGNKILFDQNSEISFDGNFSVEGPVYFLFGPEGGFEESELEAIPQKKRFSLSSNRLRSETAIIKCASLLNWL